MKNRSTKLYIAYGSNLNLAQMRLRCPAAQAMRERPQWLEDARLVFRGVADLEFEPGSIAPVGLWRITKECERALDAYEGLSSGLYFKEPLALADGRDAICYFMNDTGVAPPSLYYANAIREGYKNFKLPERYLDDAIANAWEGKRHSEQTIARYNRWRASNIVGQRYLAKLHGHVELARRPPAHRAMA